jgi:hypothetical protein
MRVLCLVLAAAGFAVSAVLHLLSFTPWATVAGERVVWALGLVAFLLALAMVARLRRSATLGRRRWGRLAFLDWRGMVRAVPPGLRFLIVGAALYAWMNFVLCVMLEVPASAQGAITLRMGTGHLIFFFLVPLVFFRFVPEGAEATRGPGGPSRP